MGVHRGHLNRNLVAARILIRFYVLRFLYSTIPVTGDNQFDIEFRLIQSGRAEQSTMLTVLISDDDQTLSVN